MYRTCHGTTAGSSRGPTPHGREREFSKPEGNTMNTTVAATDSCWKACHSPRSMVCSLTVSIWIAHCTSTYQVSRRGCARQLHHVPPGRAPEAPRTGTGQATHLPCNQRALSISRPQRARQRESPHEKGKPPLGKICLHSKAYPNSAPPVWPGGWIGDACAR